MSEEAAFLKWLAGVALAASGALTALVWNDNKRRVEELARQLSEKADGEDYARISASVEKVAEALKTKADVREIEKLNMGQDKLFTVFDKIKDQIHNGHAEILTRVNMIHTDLIQQISNKQDRV